MIVMMQKKIGVFDPYNIVDIKNGPFSKPGSHKRGITFRSEGLWQKIVKRYARKQLTEG